MVITNQSAGKIDNQSRARIAMTSRHVSMWSYKLSRSV